MTILSQNRIVQIGINSIGYVVCGKPEYPDVGARVSGVRDWIFDNSDAAQWQC